MKVNSKNRIKMLYLISLLIFITFIPQHPSIARGNNPTASSEKISLAYTAHDPIVIDSNDDFDTLGFPGSGTQTDPYLIENLNISERYVSDGIFIRDTTSYFIIQNCWISGQEYGIYLRGIIGTGTIKNNIVSYTDIMDLGLWMCNNILVEGNTVASTIDLSDTDACTIKGNTAKMIDLEDSDYNDILDNTCIGSVGSAIRVTNGDYTILSGNVCKELWGYRSTPQLLG